MYPWLWLWAPQFHFPFSGSVAQDIEPNLTWFADLISPSNGNARIEQQAFSVASYGKQIGQITDVLLELAQGENIESPQALASLESLKRIKASVEKIKNVEYKSTAARLVAEVEQLREHDGAQYASFVQSIRPLLTHVGG